jgi:hypothetical protein
MLTLIKIALAAFHASLPHECVSSMLVLAWWLLASTDHVLCDM